MMAEAGKRTSVVRGALWYVLLRWTDRCIGIISTMVLARLLVPDDFGVVAMTTMAIGLVDVFLDLGVNIALIQNAQASQAHYNTAWTLRLMQAGASMLLICAAAPFAADYFHDPRVAPVLWVMSINAVLAAAENIGTVNFQKDMRADLDFVFTFGKRLAGLLIVVVLAYYMRNYWALVAGTLLSRLVGIYLSYRMHPMRCRLSVEKWREIFGVSQWNLINSVGRYVNNNLHKLVVGGHFSATTVGGYSLADEISAMPSSEILAPVNRILFPAFVRVKHDMEELTRIFLLAQGVQCLLAIPASAGLALVAADAVFVLLGQKWSFVVPFLQVLALGSVVQALTTSPGYVLLALGRNRGVTLTTWVQVAVFAAGSLLFLDNALPLGLAWLRVAAVVAGPASALLMLRRSLPQVRWRDMAATVWRPALAALGMAVVVYATGAWHGAPALSALLAKVALGGLAYALILLLLWVAAGRPAGAETYLLDKLSQARRARQKSL